ncbi:hypothetical protein CRG98_020205 [Punica granatum]|uniref:indole-3-pyruvate monooxygenase n=1 Tax=Punica granatum TaxID=22663 RepID=A0A2I0JVE2_PUNGR|nr:hypothetical protein CRG98_020205 [Punica granatum]
MSGIEQRKVSSTVIVVGTGPSGLAAAGSLSFLGIPYMVLERDDCFAPLWQKYAYDRLHLHLAKETCQLPHEPMPADWPKYIPKQQFIDYMSGYVSRFGISPLYHRSVERACYDEAIQRWKAVAKNVLSGEIEEYHARFLVIATGESCDPFVPAVEGLESFPGKVIHSTQYKNGKEFAGKSVLVIGSGNSGMEISLDLANHGASTSIVFRSARGTMLVSRLVFGDMSKYGIPTPSEGPFTMKAKYGKFPVIDVGTCKKIRSGEIRVLPAVRSIRGSEVVFENGNSHSFDAIVFATGFKRSTNKWLQGDDYLLNEEGFAKGSFPTSNWKGKNGLYCVGLARRGIFGAGVDAQNVANDIKSLL